MSLEVRVHLHLLQPFTVSLPLTSYINAPASSGIVITVMREVERVQLR